MRSLSTALFAQGRNATTRAKISGASSEEIEQNTSNKTVVKFLEAFDNCLGSGWVIIYCLRGGGGIFLGTREHLQRSR